jgi:uncharacterized membrane protein
MKPAPHHCGCRSGVIFMVLGVLFAIGTTSPHHHFRLLALRVSGYAVAGAFIGKLLGLTYWKLKRPGPA